MATPPVKHAFFLAPDCIEIGWTNTNVPHDLTISIKKYNYDNYLKDNGHFELLDVCTPSYRVENDKVFIENTLFDLSHNYVVVINNTFNNIYLSPAIGGIIDEYFDATHVTDLGLSFDGNKAVVKVWSPPAGKIELHLFDSNQKRIQAKAPLCFENTGHGLWHLEFSPLDFEGISSLDGLFYQLYVYAYGSASPALDPYALSMAAFTSTGGDKTGKAAIVDMNALKARPEHFKRNYCNRKFMANETDMIAYEVHVRDFTIQPGTVAPEMAGTFKGFLQKAGYLKSLGVTHVQLLPVGNFYTVDETDREYRPSEATESNYNWGYDPHSFFALEGWYATDANNPYTRIKEFRELVQMLHDNGIGVIMDVVFNHTYTVETFENIAPGCYYRYDKDLKISGVTGAGPGVECRRKMVRKLITDALTHFIENYHIDGFRFDLMGFHSHETMQAVRKIAGKAYNKDAPEELILHGEGWTFSDLNLAPEANGLNAATTKLNYPGKDFDIAFFNDTTRDAFAGHKQNKGYVQGALTFIDKVASGITAGLKSYKSSCKTINTASFNEPYNMFADKPANCLNFLSIHDGFTLWDKLNLSSGGLSKEYRTRLMRMAAAMLFTSQGKIIWHGGDEILRTKPLSKFDKERNRAHTSSNADKEEGTSYFHENSYASNDFTNMIRWDRLSNEYKPLANTMLEYFYGLITMRRSLPSLRYSKPDSVKNGLTFLEPPSHGQELITFNSFHDEGLSSLEIIYKNGPPSQRLYLAGEVYPQNISPNPDDGKSLFIDFDARGMGTIKFDAQEIKQFDLNKWGNPDTLFLKLVRRPGVWETLSDAYSEMGHNTIAPQSISPNKKVFIDLSVKNCEAKSSCCGRDSFLAFHLDNTLEDDLAQSAVKTNYAELLVVHNACEEEQIVFTPYINNPNDWHVIADAENAGIKPLKFVAHYTGADRTTSVKILKENVLVAGKSTTVFAKQL